MNILPIYETSDVAVPCSEIPHEVDIGTAVVSVPLSAKFKRNCINIFPHAIRFVSEYLDESLSRNESLGHGFRIAELAHPQKERIEVLIGADYLPILHCDVAVAELLPQCRQRPVNPLRVPLFSSNRAKYLFLVHVHVHPPIHRQGNKAWSFHHQLPLIPVADCSAGLAQGCLRAKSGAFSNNSTSLRGKSGQSGEDFEQSGNPHGQSEWNSGQSVRYPNRLPVTSDN